MDSFKSLVVYWQKQIEKNIVLLYLIKLEQHFRIIRFTKYIAELQGLRKHIARVANEKSVSFCFMFYHVSNDDL